jgi:hypothetical protein
VDKEDIKDELFALSCEPNLRVRIFSACLVNGIDKLFNGENEGPALELDDSFDDTNRRFVRRGKAMGPDGIPIEVWRYLGARAIV